MNQILTEKEFYRYLFKEYQPSAYEKFDSEDLRFPEGIYYPHVCKTRYFYCYREIAHRLAKGSGEVVKVLDLGIFPGALVRVLKNLLGNRVCCYGAGLKVDRNFEAYMKPYLEQCVSTEFDPFYSKSEKAIHLDFEKETFDVVIASEVLEHLISPLELIAEGSRVLKKGGLFIVTTPNVSHHGAVIKLLLGRSNYERLDRSPMYLQQDEWRGHIRFYDKRELQTLFSRQQLKMIDHCYCSERGWDHAQRTWPQRLLFGMRKVFLCIPIYRDQHIAVFSKV